MPDEREDDLAVMIPEPVVLELAGVQVRVREPPNRDLPRFLRAARPVIDALNAQLAVAAALASVEGEPAGSASAAPGPDMLRAALTRVDWLRVIEESGESLIDACALCTDPAGADPRAWLLDQHLDVLVEVAAAVAEVNALFFVRRVLPAIARAGTRMEALAGRLPSPA